MLNKQPGQTFTLTAVYDDGATPPKTVPLASVPTAKELTGVIPVAPVGTPTVNDAQFQFSGTIPADAKPGDLFTFEIDAEGDPTPGNDTITGQFVIGVVADEDTHVTITAA